MTKLHLGNGLVYASIAVYALVQLVITASIVILQADALNAREAAVKQRQQQIDLSNLTICALQVAPEMRSDAAIEKCRIETKTND